MRQTSSSTDHELTSSSPAARDKPQGYASSGSVTHATKLERELTECLRVAEQDAWRSRTLLQQTQRVAQVGVWVAAPATNEMVWSEEVYRLTELPVNEAITVQKALSFYPSEARQVLSRAIALTLRDHMPFDLQLPYVTAKGTMRWIRTTGQAEVIGDYSSRILGTFQDLTQQKAGEYRIWLMANLDPLTGVANRALLRQALENAFSRAREKESTFAFLMLDLDGFRDINDEYGHDAGDYVLRVQADRIKAAAHQADIVARLSGDEFAILHRSSLERSDARTVADRVLHALREPIHWCGSEFKCQGSIGLAIFPDHGHVPHDLTRSANLALYKAKQGGKNTYALYAPSLRKKRESRTGALQHCKDALNENRIVPWYQPVIDVQSGRVSGFESLLRWRDNKGRVQGPSLIADAFEDAELGCLLGQRMRAKVIQDMRTWRRSGVPFGRIGVNVCEPEFLGEALADEILAALDEAQLSTRDLVLEVTENALLERSSKQAFKELQKLKAAGVHIALDDFGTGASSLVHLQRFPVNAIKIDRSFVAKMLTDERSGAIVTAIISLARQLGFDLVAEGVESVAQLDFLQTSKCPRSQGYLFARAMPMADVSAFLTGWNLHWQHLVGETARERSYAAFASTVPVTSRVALRSGERTSNAARCGRG